MGSTSLQKHIFMHISLHKIWCIEIQTSISMYIYYQQTQLMNMHASFISSANLRSMSDASVGGCICMLHPALAPYLSLGGLQYQMNTELVFWPLACICGNCQHMTAITSASLSDQQRLIHISSHLFVSLTIQPYMYPLYHNWVYPSSLIFSMIIRKHENIINESILNLGYWLILPIL